MTFGAVIPQFFYDLIARLAAGIVIGLVISVLWSHETADIRRYLLYEVMDEIPVYAGFLAIVMAYLIAILSEGVRVAGLRTWGSMRRRRRKLRRAFPKARLILRRALGRSACEALAKRTLAPTVGSTVVALRSREHLAWKTVLAGYEVSFGSSPPDVSARPSPAEAIVVDVVRVISPTAGARLMKLRAEIAFCGTVMTALLAILPVYLVHRVLLVPSGASIVSLIMVTATALGIVALFYRRDVLLNRSLNGLFIHWLLLVQPGDFRSYAKGS